MSHQQPGARVPPVRCRRCEQETTGSLWRTEFGHFCIDCYPEFARAHEPPVADEAVAQLREWAHWTHRWWPCRACGRLLAVPPRLDRWCGDLRGRRYCTSACRDAARGSGRVGDAGGGPVP